MDANLKAWIEGTASGRPDLHDFVNGILPALVVTADVALALAYDYASVGAGVLFGIYGLGWVACGVLLGRRVPAALTLVAGMFWPLMLGAVAWYRLTAWRRISVGAHRLAFEDAQLMHRTNPRSFWVPDDELLDNVGPGWGAKVCLPGERFWVFITHRLGRRFVGVVDNQLVGDHPVDIGCRVAFEVRHICDVLEPDPELPAMRLLDSADQPDSHNPRQP